MGFFDKIKAGLAKTRDALNDTLGNVFTANEIDDDFYDELEESLVLADLGVDTAMKAVTRLRHKINNNNIKTVANAKEALKEILVDMLNVGDTELNLSSTPAVILVIGVNGVGKTTTIGKIAKQQVRRSCWLLVIPSARQLRTSWRSGRKEVVLPLSASMRVQILPLLFSTASSLPRQRMWT